MYELSQHILIVHVMFSPGYLFWSCINKIANFWFALPLASLGIAATVSPPFRFGDPAICEPSPSHHLLVQTRGFAVFCVCMCTYCIFALFVYCLFMFDTIIVYCIHYEHFWALNVWIIIQYIYNTVTTLFLFSQCMSNSFSVQWNTEQSGILDQPHSAVILTLLVNRAVPRGCFSTWSLPTCPFSLQ